MTKPRAGRLGVLGGTFDPIHVGHLAVASYARDHLEIEQILFIPAGIPPHKTDRQVTPAHHRLAMVELAIAGEPTFGVSRVEIDRPGPSYAVDTMSILAREERASGRRRELFFILSAEAVSGLPGWREPERLLELCRLAVVLRDGASRPDAAWIDEHFPDEADRIIVLDGPDVPVSASKIRRMAAAGGSLEGLVPPAVEGYIVEHALYTSDMWRTS